MLLALVLPGCSAGHPSGGAASSTTRASSSPTTGAATPLVALPEGCDGGAPAPGAVVAFAAGGRSWAVSPDVPASLHCLFATPDAGVFSFGPLGDRVALPGLEVRGVGSTASRPKSTVQPVYYSWSRPTGTTVVFTDGPRHRLARADLGAAATRDITPIPGATYGDVAYHPSGLAIGFVVDKADGAEIWMATNQGQNPDRLVSAPPGTTFGHLVFAHDGTDLYYSVDRTDGSHALARYNLPTGAVAPALWTGSDRVDEIVELAGAPGVALTVGQNCASHRAILSPLDGSPGVPLTTGDAAPPGSATPTGGPPMTVVGRLDRDRFLVAVGGCNAASDLYVVHAATADAAGHVTRSPAPPVLLVQGVDAATLRQPEPTPPPPLPKNLPAAAVA